MHERRFSLPLIAFLQASGLAIYCSLVGFLLWRGGNGLFGTTSNLVSSSLILILFVTSALISALMVLGYPIVLFWDKKQATEALKLVAYTTAWLSFFVISVLLLLIIF